LVKVNETDELFQTTVTGKVCGISKIERTFKCVVCGRSGKICNEIFTCDDCSIQISRENARCFWRLNLLVKDDLSKEVMVLYFDNDMSHLLANIMEFELTTEEEVAAIFLGKCPSVEITFEMCNKYVKNVCALGH